MAPNSSKTIAIRELDVPKKVEYKDRDEIRTDFVLQNIFSYLMKNVISFQATSATSIEEDNFMYVLQQIIDDFKLYNGEKIEILCTSLNITKDKLECTINQVSDELFCEGVTWSRIIALFVFVSTLTTQCIQNDISEDVVDEAYAYFCLYVKKHLKQWVMTNGGWKGILTLHQAKPSGWTKSLLRSTVSMLGSTLARLTNLPY